jgi:hypothetical protein
MFKLARLKPFGEVAGWMIVVGVAVNVALTALNATPALAWLPKTVTGTGFLEESRSRVTQAAEEYRTGRIPSHQRLATLVGISNMREAIDLSVLSKVVGEEWRFLGVAGAGFGMDAIREYADLVLSSDLRPDVAVLGFGLHQLGNAPPGRGLPKPLGVVGYLSRGNVRQAAIALRDSTWSYARRQDVRVTVEAAALDLRAWLFDRFGVRLPQPIEQSPWREMVRSDWPDHFSDATLRAQEKAYAEYGLFELETYQNSKKNITILLNIIEQFRRQHTKVVLVLLPEHSRLSERIPTQALDVMQRHLRERFAAETPPVLDFRQAVDDAGLVDLPHLNQKGRIEFSRKLADGIREILPEREAPQRVSGAAGTKPASPPQMRAAM